MAPGEEVSDPAAARARERRLGLGLRGLRRKKGRLLPRYSTRGATVPRVLFTRWRLGLVVGLEAQDRRIVIPDDMVDSRIRGYPPSRWRLWEVFGSNLACSSLIQDSLFYRDD